MAAGLPVVSTTLDGLRSVFQREKKITWAEDARMVIREALQLNDNRIVGVRTAPLDATESGLSMFESEVTLGLFETSLTSLSHEDKQ
jgi:hypothetical protein